MLNLPLVSLFSFAFILNYFGYYFEQIKFSGVTAAKITEFVLMFLLLAATVLKFNIANKKFRSLYIFYILFLVAILRSGFVADFLRKEYIVFYFGAFYIAGYTLSGSDTYPKLFNSLKKLFLGIALIGVLFFVLGIDYKLEIYSEDEGNFYHPDLGRPRATSFLYNPQAFGMICVMATIMNGHLSFSGIPLIGLYFSYSRSSVISLVASMLSFRLKNIVFGIVFSLLFYLIISWANIPGFSRYLDFSQYIEDVRVLKFAVGLSVLSESPMSIMFGVPYVPMVEESGITFSDNAYIYLALKGGVVLLLTYLYFLYQTFVFIRHDNVLRRIFWANIISGFFTISFAYIGFNFLFLMIGSYIKSTERSTVRSFG